jgi:hypothetical protein
VKDNAKSVVFEELYFESTWMKALSTRLFSFDLEFECYWTVMQVVILDLIFVFLVVDIIELIVLPLKSLFESKLWYTYICWLQLGSHPVAVVQYTFTHKHPLAAVQYTFTHKQYTERHKTNNNRTTLTFGKVRAVPHLYGFYPDICLTTEEKARKNLSKGSRRGSAGKMRYINIQ